jgi:hypothetical protein
MPSSTGGWLLRAKPAYPAAVRDFLCGAYTFSMLRFGGAEQTIADAPRLVRAATLPTKRRSTGFRVKFKTRAARI